MLFVLSSTLTPRILTLAFSLSLPASKKWQTFKHSHFPDASNTKMFIQKCKLTSSQAGISTLQHNIPKHCHGSRRISTAGSLRTTSQTRHCSLPAPWFLHTLALEGPKCASLETHCQVSSIFNRQAVLPKQSEKHALRSTLSGPPGQPRHRSGNSACTSKLGQKKTQNKSECGQVWKHSK